MAGAYEENKVHIRRRTMKKNHGDRTEFIFFNSRKCRSCWKCIEVCPKKVFGRINIIIHKHALIRNGEKCSGCGKCVKSCTSGAIIYLNKNQQVLQYEQQSE